MNPAFAWRLIGGVGQSDDPPADGFDSGLRLAATTATQPARC